MTLRPAKPDELGIILDIHRQAFGRELEALVAEKLTILPEYLPDLSLVAETEEGIVGHVMLSLFHHENPDWERRIVALGPIGVLPHLQREGIGSALMRGAIERAAGAGYRGIALLGHPTYYPRFGFRPASTWGISFSYDVPDDVAMALELEPGSLQGAAGNIYYSAAFGAT